MLLDLPYPDLRHERPWKITEWHSMLCTECPRPSGCIPLSLPSFRASSIPGTTSTPCTNTPVQSFSSVLCKRWDHCPPIVACSCLYQGQVLPKHHCLLCFVVIAEKPIANLMVVLLLIILFFLSWTVSKIVSLFLVLCSFNALCLRLGLVLFSYLGARGFYNWFILFNTCVKFSTTINFEYGFCPILFSPSELLF